ncbi:MAG: hypothetical protein SGJ27_17425 [Candidatus Melainabacteria bacterium]|nr:hypothetical protein [Candidatus Melainabacteria bacterium]
MIKTIAPALRALVEDLIDYAGVFPPASVELDKALEQFKTYQNGEHTWMLRWFVVSGKDVDQVPSQFDGALSIIAIADDSRAAALETTAVIEASHPVYCEVKPGDSAGLDAIKQANNFAKIRMGGVKPETIPSPADVARFINDCAERKLAFKATAGLHHPIRAEYALTYKDDAPRAVMHGFLNTVVASVFAWHGERDIEPILAETDVRKFSFDDKLHWQGKELTVEQIRDARKNFFHAIGSCSFEEPVQELCSLGLL